MLDKFRETAITWDKANRKVYEPLRASAGDNKGRKLSVQVVNGGVIEDLSGASLSLFWKTKDKAHKGLDAFTAVNAVKGEFEIYYTTGMLSNEGTLNANLVLVDANGRIVSEPFTITVFKGIDDDAIQSENSFTSLTQALIDISNLEQNYAPRLNDLTAQLAQTDFVSQVSNLIGGYEKMYYKRENTPGWVTVMLRNKKEHVSWTFRNNVYDDFYILGDCFYGDVTESLTIYQNENYESTTGTGWVKTAPNAHYTTIIGDTMTNYIEGEKIEFHYYADNRGGIWEFIVDDVIDKPILISTWSETVVATNNKTVIEGLPFGTHKIVATFKGDDPLHAPSTGAGTSRGWVYVNGANNYLTFRAFKTQLSNSRVKDLLVAFSNKEFAFSIRQQGSTAPYQFVPMHNNIGTGFEKQPVKFVADSDVLNESQINSLTISEFIECEKFSAIQSIYGRNPNNGATNLLEINTNVTINKNGNVEITGKMKPLVNIEIDNGYGIMLPVNKGVATKTISSKGNEYPITKTDGTSTFLDKESDNTTSFLFISSEASDFAVSARFNDIRNTLRSGQNKGTNIAPFWIEHRDATMQKMYFRQFYKQILTPADTFKFSATLNCGKIMDVFNLV